MRTPMLLMLVLAVAACDVVVGDTSEHRQALEVEINETLTVSHLRSLVGAQTQARSLSIIDADEDGGGEYAFIAELSGSRNPRGPGAGLKFPLLGADFRTRGVAGAVEVHGYLYKVYLPGADGKPASDPSDVSADRAEGCWAAYAWPTSYGVTGKRTFFVDGSGVVYAKDSADFSGRNAPAPDAALSGEKTIGTAVPDGWAKVN